MRQLQPHNNASAVKFLVARLLTCQCRLRRVRLAVWVIGSILGLMRRAVPFSGEFLFQWQPASHGQGCRLRRQDGARL
jgi:hypothetical protein